MKVILLHGMGGGPADWNDVRSLFPAEAWSLPAKPTLEEVAEELADRLSQETAPYGLAGYSLGGRLAILLTHRLLNTPHCPRKLALLSAGLGFPTEEEKRARILQDRAWSTLAEQNPEEFWRRWYAQGLFSTFAELPSATQERWLHARRSLEQAHLSRQLEDWSPSRHPYLKPLLLEIQKQGISTLYLAGERDKKYQSLAGELSAEGLNTVILPNAGHLLPLEAPAAVASAFAGFFV